MPLNRRRFLSDSARVTAGFLGLQALNANVALGGAAVENPGSGYGELVSDPDGIFDLPKGFSYKIIAKEGEPMADGLKVPGKPDGMAAFAGPDDTTIIMVNHEISPENSGAFGKRDELIDKIDRRKLYDADEDKTTCPGGVSTIVYDTNRKQVIRHFLRLGGTIRNCAGGPTPWNSWITCEECNDRVGKYPKTKVTLGKDHGYNFDVPASDQPGLVDAVPLIAMGRFRHEAVAVDPKTNIVYQTEDRDEGLFFRFLPTTPQKLSDGGRLQALAIKGEPSRDTRNWKPKIGKSRTPRVAVGQTFQTDWIDIEDVTSPGDDLRFQGFDRGAARFARGEGIWLAGENEFYFACTTGGRKQKGQIWKYTPGTNEGQADEEPGTLELFIEANKPGMVENADNLTVAPWGDLMVCEDRTGKEVRLVGVTMDGQQYPFGSNHTGKELAGVCFSPDGSTLFVNIQHKGWTLAVTGPWQS